MTPQEEDGVLFSFTPQWAPAHPGRRRSTRTRRQWFLIDIGLHPLSLILRRPLRLLRPRALTRSCGTCVHLGKLDWKPTGAPNPSPLKCWMDSGARVTRGAATTVRRWWPACVDYEGVSDAATGTTAPDPAGDAAASGVPAPAGDR